MQQQWQCIPSRDGLAEVWRPLPQKVHPMDWEQAFDQTQCLSGRFDEVLDRQLETELVEPAAFVTEYSAALQCCPHHLVCAANPVLHMLPLKGCGDLW